MNFVKRNFPIVMNLISVIIIIISIESVTSNGIIEGSNTFYKTISLSSKPFNLLFFVGLLFFVVSAINYYKTNKIKSIILIILDIIFSAISFVLFQNGNYLLMTGFVITIFMLQFSLQSNWKNKVYTAMTIAFSIGLWIINIYFLIKQFTIMIGVADVAGALLDDLITTSRTNAICLCLFIIPCIVSIIGSIKSQEKKNSS